MFWLSSRRNILLFLLPSIIIYVVYIIFPIVMTVCYSFTDFRGIGSADFIGFENYRKLFADPLFFIALKNTFIILGMAILLLLPFSFLVGIIFSKPFKGNTLTKVMIFSPNVIAPIIVGVIWVYILDPNMGFVNNVLDLLGLDTWERQWIGGKTLTPYSIGFVYVWQTIGFNATIFLTGLSMIPKEMHEAAQIDGANSRQRLFFITIPMLKDTFIINLVLIISNALKIFELIVQMTGGGPNNLSHVLNTYMYYRTFTTSQYGYGMSIAVVVLLLVSGISVSYIKNARRKLPY